MGDRYIYDISGHLVVDDVCILVKDSISTTNLLILAFTLDFIFMTSQLLSQFMGHEIDTSIHVLRSLTCVDHSSSFEDHSAFSNLRVFLGSVGVLLFDGILMHPENDTRGDDSLDTQLA